MSILLSTILVGAMGIKWTPFPKLLNSNSCTRWLYRVPHDSMFNWNIQQQEDSIILLIYILSIVYIKYIVQCITFGQDRKTYQLNKCSPIYEHIMRIFYFNLSDKNLRFRIFITNTQSKLIVQYEQWQQDYLNRIYLSMYINDRYTLPVYKHGNNVHMKLKKLSQIHMTFNKVVYSLFAEVRVIVRL